MEGVVIGGSAAARLRPRGFGRRGSLWRRLLGLAITLASVAAVVLVGQLVGWLTDSRATQHAGQAADGRARMLAMSLRQLPPDGRPLEARFVETADPLGVLLLGADYRGANEAVLTVRVVGEANTGAFDGRRSVLVARCYTLDWQPPVLDEPVPIGCPVLPSLPDGATSGSELAAALNAGLRPNEDAGPHPAPPGPYLAVGVEGACAYSFDGPDGRTAWPAPLLASCTEDAARRAAALRW